MNIKELEYFKTVCQHKSITKAAHALYMTPQGLSKIIKNIESEMGASLLNRTGTGISLTEAGAYLYARLPEFLNSYHSICSEIRCIEHLQRVNASLIDVGMDFESRKQKLSQIYIQRHSRALLSEIKRLEF